MINKMKSKYIALIAFILLWLYVKTRTYNTNNNSRVYVEGDLTDLIELTEKQHKSNQKFNYIKRYNSSFLACNSDLNLPKLTRNSLLRPNKTHRRHKYFKPAANQTHSSRIVRALTFYFPIEKQNYFEYEFRWVYRSWIEMQRYEPAKWRTDLILFIQNNDTYFKKESFFLNQLKCAFTNIRTSKFDKPMCTLIHYIPLKERVLSRLSNPIFRDETEKNKMLKYEHLLSKLNIFNDNPENLLPFYHMLQVKLSKYGYLDSILMAFDGYNYFKKAKFDFLVRSDMDIFLTPFFGLWLPRHCNDFIVGGGAYSENFNRKRLKRISQTLGLSYIGEDNLGSTWYSTPDQFRLVSYLTLVNMIYISSEEFTIAEKNGKKSFWPYWSHGVVLLYGQDVALNHLSSTNQINLKKLNKHIDFPSGNTESVFTKIMIHVFHGDSMFSKFHFKVGKYDNLSIPTNNTEKVKFYCLKMALEGKRTNASDLHKQLLIETNKKF